MEMQSPLDVEHVEKLILSLYAPNPPEVISRIQGTLSQIQNSQSAWILSRELLTRPDEKVQFFGALTLIVKLNTASDSLSDEEATELLMNMLGWYLESLHKASGRLVTRKLVSALATYFFRFYRLWPQYLAHVVICLAAGQTRPVFDEKKKIDLGAALASLDAQRAQAALWVASHIVEDASRLDMNSSANAGVYEAILQSLPDTISLLSKCMNADATPPSVVEDCMKCLQAWVGFTQRLSSRDHQVIDSLRPLFTNVINSLRNETSYEVAVEVLIEVLSNYPSLLNQEHNSMIAGLLQTPWASSLYQRLVGGDFEFDTVQFGLLYLEFAQTKVEDLIKSCNSHGKPLLYSLCGMLAAEGYPIAENKIFVPTIDFWSNFAETMPEYIPTDGEQQEEFVSPAIEFLVNAVSNSWQKIIFPPGSEFSQWDSNDRAGFHDARKDVVDLLQSMYVLVGPQMVITFVDATLSALSEASWLRMEAAAYCLGGLADCCREDERCDETLTRLFESPLFSILQNNRDTLPPRVRQTCLSLIELYTEYFERNTKFLPPALELLFSMLADASMAPTASKSIFRLCSTCRDRLHTDIDAFLHEYQRHTTNRQLDCPSTEKILGSLACIAQAIPDQQRKYVSCARILNLVEREVENSKALLASNRQTGSGTQGVPCQDCSDDEHPALHAGLKSLRCLTSIGKGFQAPADAAIDLESSGSGDLVRDPQLGAVQKQVVNIIVAVQQTFNTSTEVTELICSVLRAGFSETEPGPFVLPPSEVAQYLASHTYATPRIGLFVSAACSFLSSMRGLQGEQHLLANILLWIISLLRQMPDIDAEPELVQNGIEFASRLLSKSPRTLLELQPSDAAEYFFLLTLQVLDGKEPLPKAAAAEFWATLVSLRPSDKEIQPLLNAAITTLGPFLSKSLARNIGGNASRSELDRLSEPLKKLISRHAKSKEWLELALNDEAFPSNKVSSEEKSMFLKKVISLRGSRATNQVVRDFWLACRGSNFAYAS